MIGDEVDILRAALEAIPAADPTAQTMASDRLDQLLRAMSNQEGLVGHADTRVQLVLPEPVGDVDEHGRARGGRSPSRWLRLALVVLRRERRSSRSPSPPLVASCRRGRWRPRSLSSPSIRLLLQAIRTHTALPGLRRRRMRRRSSRTEAR